MIVGYSIQTTSIFAHRNAVKSSIPKLQAQPKNKFLIMRSILAQRFENSI